MSASRLAVAVCLTSLTGVAVLAAPDPSKVTFNKDVLPILQKNCQSCHRPGEVAPMSLLSYSDARPWAKSIKAAVVARDERESGLRAILNFGHTFGHAIEAGLGYGEWLHGEAVGCGMAMAADLSSRLGLIEPAYVARLERLIDRAGLPLVAPALPVERYLELMRVDKKAEGGELRFVVIEAPGRAALRTAPEALVREVIDAHRAR